MPFTAASLFQGANQPGPGWIYRPPQKPPAVAVFFSAESNHYLPAVCAAAMKRRASAW